MRLIIAEKPSVARGIADVLGHASKSNGCITCGTTTMTWCSGHLLEQANPEQYVQGGSVRRQDLPVLPERWQLRPRVITPKSRSPSSRPCSKMPMKWSTPVTPTRKVNC